MKTAPAFDKPATAIVRSLKLVLLPPLGGGLIAGAVWALMLAPQRGSFAGDYLMEIDPLSVEANFHNYVVFVVLSVGCAVLSALLAARDRRLAENPLASLIVLGAATSGSLVAYSVGSWLGSLRFPPVDPEALQVGQAIAALVPVPMIPLVFVWPTLAVLLHFFLLAVQYRRLEAAIAAPGKAQQEPT